jgi:methylglutaconyl-CoA hydratase
MGAEKTGCVQNVNIGVRWHFGGEAMSIDVREDKKYFAEVVLNRPSLRNAFDPEMITKITSTFQKLAQEKHWRAIILKGEGKVFCAGADLKWMESMVNFTYAENEADAQKLFAMFEAIEQCPHPVISVVHGAAMGGALGLMAASDIVIAEQSTQFCFSEVKLGIAPAVISAFVLKNRQAAPVAPWMMSGRIFNANQALQMGLVTEIYYENPRMDLPVKTVLEPPDKNNNSLLSASDLEAILNGWKIAFVEAAPQAVRVTKDLLKKVSSSTYSVQKTLTTQAIAERRVSAEGQEGLKSFLNKTVPLWRKS